MPNPSTTQSQNGGTLYGVFCAIIIFLSFRIGYEKNIAGIIGPPNLPLQPQAYNQGLHQTIITAIISWRKSLEIQSPSYEFKKQKNTYYCLY